jgi:hypothetical protein
MNQHPPPINWEQYCRLLDYIQAWERETDHPLLDIDQDRMGEHDRELPVSRLWAREEAPDVNEKGLVRFLKRRNAVCDCAVQSIKADDLVGHEEWSMEADARVQERQRRHDADRRRREGRGG